MASFGRAVVPEVVQRIAVVSASARSAPSSTARKAR